MASSGPNYPAVGSSVANAGTSENANAWVNPTNIGSSSAVASITAATFDSPDISEILVAEQFGFAIPGTATVTGITVEISKRGYTSANSGKDFRVQLSTDATFAGLVGNNKASASVWPQTTLATTTYGSSSDTWAAGLTAAQVNSNGFAVLVSAYANVANADIDVDWIRVTVEYTTPPNTNANAEVATATGASNPDTAKVSAAGTGVSTGTGATAAAWPTVAPWAGLALSTGAGLDATVDAQAGAIQFLAGLAEGTADAIVARASLASTLGFAAGRSS